MYDTGFPKMYHYFNHMPFPCLLTEANQFRHAVSNICRFWLPKIQVKRCNDSLTKGGSRNHAILARIQTVATISWTPQRVWRGVSWSTPVQTHCEACEHFSDCWQCFQHSDQRRQTSIGRKHPKTIDVAREFSISRSDKSPQSRFSINYQTRTPHFHFWLEFG